MKKIISALILLSVCNKIFSQEIFIGNEKGNRPLVWNDFSGPSDGNADFDANTFWKIDYTISGIIFAGDTAKIKGFNVVLRMLNNLSWVKPESKSDYLLNHEQMHFNIALICQNEILQRLKTTILFRNNFKTAIPKIFSETLEKYKKMEITYDEATNHSKDKAQQTAWNNKILSALKTSNNF